MFLHRGTRLHNRYIIPLLLYLINQTWLLLNVTLAQNSVQLLVESGVYFIQHLRNRAIIYSKILAPFSLVRERQYRSFREDRRGQGAAGGDRQLLAHIVCIGPVRWGGGGVSGVHTNPPTRLRVPRNWHIYIRAMRSTQVCNRMLLI